MTIERVNFSKMLNWNLLKIFHEIVQAQGISSAAQQISRKQSTVSHALKRLEEELGVRLCTRGPSGFELTDEGQIVSEYCEAIFKNIGEIPNRIDNLEEDIHGQLNFQIISNIVCPELDNIFYSYNKSYPHVEFVVEIVPSEGIPQAILRNEIDIGIAPANIIYPELKYDFLFTENHRVYCGKSHPLFGKTIEDIGELANQKFILTGSDEPDQLTKLRLKYGLGHHIAGVSSHLEEAKRLTTIGSGLCFLPDCYAEKDVDKGELWPVTNVTDELALEIYVISFPQTQGHLIRQLFIDEVKSITSV